MGVATGDHPYFIVYSFYLVLIRNDDCVIPSEPPGLQ